MSTETGAHYIARILKSLNVNVVFGVVGIPVVEIAEALTQIDVTFIACRTEQTASYAACAYGYLTKKAGVLLVVSGPGLVHALSGMSFAKENCWPLVVLAGSTGLAHEYKGGFQELNQMQIALPFAKFTARPSGLDSNLAYVLSKAFRMAEYGRPGVSYIDIPANFIVSQVQPRELLFSENLPCQIPPAPAPVPSAASLDEAVALLRLAARPLVIIGKGCAYARCEIEARSFIQTTQLPFLPTPMGKGVLPDTHELCVSAARASALKEADVVLLLGARLNWMLHFGSEPRFSKHVRIIQVDICAEELGNSVPAHRHTFLNGGLKETLQALTEKADFCFQKTTLGHPNSAWWMYLERASKANLAALAKKVSVVHPSYELNYYNVYSTIKQMVPDFEHSVVLVSEGANTMDISRAFFMHAEPRKRLDAGSTGTMGVGVGFSIAASMAYLNSGAKVIAIMGDSAFGFSGMDLETVSRYNLEIIFVIMNNNGIYSGLPAAEYAQIERFKKPSTLLTPDAQYNLIATAFNGRGFNVSTLAGLKQALAESLALKKTFSVINVRIKPFIGSEPSRIVSIPKL